MESLLPLTRGDAALAQKMADQYLNNIKDNSINIVSNNSINITPNTIVPIAGFFENSNLQGQSLTMTPGNSSWGNLSALSPDLYNKISSVWCTDPQYFISLYAGLNFTGSVRLMRAPTIALNLKDYGFNDVTKSISATIIGSLPTLTLFKDSDNRGASDLFIVGSEMLNMNQTLIGNDTLSSICISPNSSITIYKDINFTGDSKTYTNTTTGFASFNLSPDGFNDSCSSFKSTTI